MRRASAALAGSLLACAACSGEPPAGRTRPPPLVAVAKVEARDVARKVRAPVDLRPLAQADVGAKTLGYLDAVLVDRGDEVKKGQLLALVRPSDLPDQLAAARGSLAQVQAQLALTRQNRDRAERLAPSGVVSEQELQQSRAAFAAAEAAAGAARAQTGALGTRLSENRIEAPMAGLVSRRLLDPGALVGPGSGSGPILTIVRSDVLRVFIPVVERDVDGLRVGLTAEVELDAFSKERFTGQVVRLSPAVDPLTRTLEAEVHLPNPEGRLRPGMYGRGAIILERRPARPVVPEEAVQLSGDKRYVFVLEGQKVRRRAIETGVDEGSFLEVRGGLRAGEDEIVTAGIDGLSDGAVVRPARAAAPGAPAASTSGGAR